MPWVFDIWFGLIFPAGRFESEAFDDETSTFTCRTAESQGQDNVPNKAGYNITLCPTEPDFVEVDGGTDKAKRV